MPSEVAAAAATAATGPDLTLLALILHADPIVKAVMLLLTIASVACWSIILDRTVRLAQARRDIRRLDAKMRGAPDPGEARAAGATGISAQVLAAGAAEWRDPAGDYPESRAERRDRIDRAMRSVIAAEVRKLEQGLSFLATVGSVAPFVGLFGTVWGIMNSFGAIAGSQDTSLAVVAPGIAEALFATALGLVAAIPAVVGYNRLGGALAKLAYSANAAAADFANRLAKTAPPVATPTPAE